MLKIRFQRIGRINQPAYRIVVIEHARAAKSGNFVEQVGTYNPKTKERTLAADRITYWLSKGAQASGTVHNMLISAGIIKGKKINVLPKKTVPQKAEEPAPAAASQPQAETPEPAVDAPAEETTEAEAVAA